MEARLTATAGPLKGTVFSLSEQETYIGRNPDNLAWIHDPNRPTNRSVSRRHCLIRREAGQFSVRDLDSLNGTFVNGATVKERLLEDGDQIQIGDSLLMDRNVRKCLFRFRHTKAEQWPFHASGVAKTGVKQ